MVLKRNVSPSRVAWRAISGLLSQAIIGAGGLPRLPAIASSYVCFCSGLISSGESSLIRMVVFPFLLLFFRRCERQRSNPVYCALTAGLLRRLRSLRKRFAFVAGNDEERIYLIGGAY